MSPSSPWARTSSLPIGYEASPTRRSLRLPPARFSEEIDFPWKAKSRVLDEIAEELRHSALHRGHVQELKKLYARRNSVGG